MIKYNRYNLRPNKTIFLLVKSEKWEPYRDYSYEVYGTKSINFVFGLLIVLMTPILFWIIRRGENGIQFLFGARTLAKMPSGNEDHGQSIHFFESIVVIHQHCQIPTHSKGLQQKGKLLFGIVLSKIYFFGLLFFFSYGFDQISSEGFRCRNLKGRARFLLSNNTQPADDLNMTFPQIYEMRKENANGLEWYEDNLNGLLSQDSERALSGVSI